ncbi:DMT family transporter [Flavobacterium phragmitis]|jgi:drug/metabolite transporter (DMT)-like permease|uniref:Permease of the drug/metabolite transporter (DMT) superfamily n=1 Tax=Flavobacterium phragmitis TaxID=739143 RepID=A0A1I1WRD7_9FLAO|nr:EamA family transporter [Flavobacterium phragmitis]SFD97755.1 Permease of the drug/metabolite transporter (DMT) superfamily [Flavobacterium phragmitis]
MKEKNKQLAGFSLAIIAAIFWGVSGTFGQFLFQQRQINVEWLVTVRLLFSAILLLLFSLISKQKDLWLIWRNKRDVLHLLLFSLLGMMAVQYTYFAAIKYSNAATATVLQYSGPVIIAVYLALKNKKNPKPIEYLAIFLAVVGTYLLVTHGKTDGLSISTAALYWGLASALSLAFYSIQPIGLLKRYNSAVVIGWAMLIGGIVLSFVHSPLDVTGEWDKYTYLYTAFIILFGTLAAFYFYLTAVKIIGSQKTSLLASAEPLSAAIISVLWLNVTFGIMDWIGSIFIISTIFLLRRL